MTWVYYLISLTAGFAISVQVAINGQLRAKIGSSILSSFISFGVGTIGLLAVFLFMVLNGSSQLPSVSHFKSASWWMYLGGLLGAFYIFTTIFASPKIGFANMFSLVICGQIILAVIFDHFGFLGNQILLVTPLRALGILLLISGVYLIQTN